MQGVGTECSRHNCCSAQVQHAGAACMYVLGALCSWAFLNEAVVGDLLVCSNNVFAVRCEAHVAASAHVLPVCHFVGCSVVAGAVWPLWKAPVNTRDAPNTLTLHLVALRISFGRRCFACKVLPHYNLTSQGFRTCALGLFHPSCCLLPMAAIASRNLAYGHHASVLASYFYKSCAMYHAPPFMSMDACMGIPSIMWAALRAPGHCMSTSADERSCALMRMRLFNQSSKWPHFRLNYGPRCTKQ